VIDNFQKVKVLQCYDISREEQHHLFYKFFNDYCQKESNLEHTLQSISIIHDKHLGTYTFIGIVSNYIFLSNVQESSHFPLEHFNPALMHPFTIAAYELGYGKQLDKQYSNVFLQKRDDK
jgi:hypothetical protein